MVHEVTNGEVGVRVVRCVQQPFGTLVFQCQTVEAWGTGDIPGQEFQPTIALVDRSPSQTGTPATWSYAVYNDGLTFQPQGEPRQRLRAVQVFMLGGVGTESRLVRRSAGVAADVCPALYPGTPYWGDYFGYIGFQRLADRQWVHLAAFSHDQNQGCTFINIWQGFHLYIASTTWIDP